ncbi:hypothetical protein [Flavobacterium reichenbachii]|uniref:Uncharacterized protein n=1 Tax=Flavobacterium reichenbachii TaxID=362418 RepID=A0A085ZQG6_9FLAO|nr:hypothetical protein [Flavobacterium reichenbachii]KFF06680.1 hypothetical protein IW19_14725 [Flavobacterium reichenbachii]OXB18714.1 hypothetical protein B0A68_01480 [Flavobacterium reichenbachii]
MTEQNNYIEIGRGAELIPMEYWHQYVLGIDLTEELNFLVVSEVGKNEIIYQKRISLFEIHNPEWSKLLEISKTKVFIDKLIEISSDKKMVLNELNKISKSIDDTMLLLNGNWISENEYSGLNYNSNFSNWIDAIEIKGHLKFTLDLQIDNKRNCHVEIPVNYLNGGDGYFSIKMGRFELSKNQILIWQNDTFPSNIKYELSENGLILDLFEHQIKFIRI